METLGFLGRALGFSVAAGVNLYATVAILGLAARYEWASLPPEYQVFDNDWVIGTAAFLYVFQFVADKIPWVDTLWDALHTLVRPVGGALIAVAALGEASAGATAAIALLGGTVAAGSHATKAATRLVVNSSPEPFSNWLLSFSEDGFVIGLGFLALTYPVAALVVTVVVLVFMLLGLALIVRAIRRRRRGVAPATA